MARVGLLFTQVYEYAKNDCHIIDGCCFSLGMGQEEQTSSETSSQGGHSYIVERYICSYAFSNKAID